MRRIVTTIEFERVVKKLVKRDPLLRKKFAKSVKLLKKDPYTPSLRTHKVFIAELGKVWSSRVTGDLRIIWILKQDNNGEKEIIMILTVGGHSGRDKVYM